MRSHLHCGSVRVFGGLLLTLMFAACSSTPVQDCRPEVDYFASVRDQLDAQEYATVIEAMTCVIRIYTDDEKDMLAFFWRGLAYEGQQDYENALEDYTSALRLNPGNEVILTRRAEVYKEMGRSVEALDDARQALRSGGNSPEGWVLIGRIYLSSSQPDRAIDALENALEIDPDYAPAYRQMAVALMQSGQCEQAIDAADRAQALSGEFPTGPNFVRSFCAVMAGDQETGRQSAQSVVDENPEAWEAFFARGFVSASEGNLLSAIFDLEHALDLNPNVAPAHMLLGEIWFFQEDYQRAAEHYRLYESLNGSTPIDADIRAHMDEAYERVQDE